ncbi:Uncharacterized protein Rs2_02859 [Raphanus sativus]|nr:Uncharacterized protein Rs2_02859 [Raphanus sativus]
MRNLRALFEICEKNDTKQRTKRRYLRKFDCWKRSSATEHLNQGEPTTEPPYTVEENKESADKTPERPNATTTGRKADKGQSRTISGEALRRGLASERERRQSRAGVETDAVISRYLIPFMHSLTSSNGDLTHRSKQFQLVHLTSSPHTTNQFTAFPLLPPPYADQKPN